MVAQVKANLASLDPVWTMIRREAEDAARSEPLMASLVVSEDLDELLSLADRIAVMHDGHVVGVVDAAGADRMSIGRLMLGGAAA